MRLKLNPSGAAGNDQLQALSEKFLRTIPDHHLATFQDEGARITNKMIDISAGTALPIFDNKETLVMREMLNLAMSSIQKEIYRRLDEQNKED